MGDSNLINFSKNVFPNNIGMFNHFSPNFNYSYTRIGRLDQDKAIDNVRHW